jgi:hypothetical protein
MRVTALLDQPFAPSSMADISAATRSEISTLIAELFAAWHICFLVFFLEEFGLAHGDRWIDWMTMGRMN